MPKRTDINFTLTSRSPLGGEQARSSASDDRAVGGKAEKLPPTASASAFGLASATPPQGGSKNPRAQHKGRGVGGRLTTNARQMRKTPTDAERRLWRYLSNKNLGFRFRRQHAMGGKYIVDFVCLEKKLVIELDGGQHAEQQKNYDEERTKFLDKEGYRVLRFWNNEVLAETKNVCEMILLALDTPHDSPLAHLLPPKGGAGVRRHA